VTQVLQRKIPGVDLAVLIVYQITNILFVYKYAARFSGNPWPFVLIYLVVLNILILFFYKDHGPVRHTVTGSRIFFLSVIALALLLSVIMLRFNPEQIRVGRYPALHDWITRLLSGRFPYASATRPSGFPFLFVLAMPFYLLGDLGFLQVFAFFVYAFLLYIRYGKQDGDRFQSLMLLVTAPLFLYEIVVRSDLFSNMVIVILFMGYCEGTLHKAKTAALLLIGCTGGLLLATRGIVLLIYVIYFGYIFRSRIERGLIFTCGVLAGFIATLLPFAAWSWGFFITSGPFAIQTSYLPLGLSVPALVLCIFMAARAKSLTQVYRSIAFMLFSIVLAAFLISVASNGWSATILGDRFDISYFCFTLPFLLLLLGYGRTDSLISLKYSG
jgi:hypothetical protein